MSLGFGVMSFGLGAFGLATPDDPPAEATGPVGSRYINPATGDYEVDEVSHNLAQMPGVRQRVLLALITLRRSAVMVGFFGNTMPRKMGTSFEIEVRQSVALALRHLTDVERAIRVDEILVERGRNSRAQVTVSYVDLVTSERDRVTTNI